MDQPAQHLSAAPLDPASDLGRGAGTDGSLTPSRSKAYLAYAMTVLCVINALNYMDRNILSILLPLIKSDLALSDTQAGLLSGLAFAVVYCVLGVPLARIADRGWNVEVLTVSATVWSAATACCAYAVSFPGLLAARMGVGVGEAGGGAPMLALVSHYFSPKTRGRALGGISAAGGLGSIAGSVVGGILGDHYGWREAFMFLGIPGALFSVLGYLTLKRPARSARDSSRPADPEQNTLWVAIADLASRKSFVHITLGLAVAATGLYGLASWMPMYFMRTYAASATTVGGLWGLVSAPTALAGILLGGFYADRLSKRDVRWPIWLFIIGLGGVSPIYLVVLLSPNMTLGMILSVPAGIMGSLWIAPSLALVQNLSGTRSRATAAALFALAVNLVGLGLGPTLTGVLSDLLQPFVGAQSLLYAMCAMLLPLAYSVVHFLIAARTVAADLASIEARAA